MQPDAEGQARTEQLVRLIAHDLRNPLTAVQLNGQLIERAAARDGQAKQERWAHLIVEAARRMDDLLGKLVECERIRSGRIPMPLAKVRLDELVRELVAATPHPVAVTGGDAATVVRGNRVRLAQAIESLLALAAQEADHGTRIRIELDTDGGRARCALLVPRPAADAAVAPDDGPTPAAPHPPANTGGQAIILHHAQTVIESHGGTLEVLRAPDHETRFTITLPLA